MPLHNAQVGNTCQYYTLLNLMDFAGRGALDSEENDINTARKAGESYHFNDCLAFLVNKTPNSSGFISLYSGRAMNGTTAINSINNLPLGQNCYVDNHLHAMIIRRNADNTYSAWNSQNPDWAGDVPQWQNGLTLGTQRYGTPTRTENVLIINTNCYPSIRRQSYQTQVDVYLLKDSLANTDAVTTERQRQIRIIDRLAAFFLQTQRITGFDPLNHEFPNLVEEMTRSEKNTVIGNLRYRLASPLLLLSSAQLNTLKEY